MYQTRGRLSQLNGQMHKKSLGMTSFKPTVVSKHHGPIGKVRWAAKVISLWRQYTLDNVPVKDAYYPPEPHFTTEEERYEGSRVQGT